jgi:hypothetical protein
MGVYFIDFNPENRRGFPHIQTEKDERGFYYGKDHDRTQSIHTRGWSD